MPTDPDTNERLHVAIGAVVENMSTLKIDTPTPTSLDALRSRATCDLRVLITLREQHRVLGGLWELPGGKVEANEQPRDAVVRELREEVGIEVEPLLQLPAVDHNYAHASLRLLPFICIRTAGLPRKLEVQDARWIGLNELDGYRFPDASLPVIAALIDAMQSPTDTPPLVR